MLRSIYAGLQQTSVTYEEASQNMGATPIRTLYKITLPLVVANILAGAILVFSFSMLEVSDSSHLSDAGQILSDYKSDLVHSRNVLTMVPIRQARWVS